MGEHATVLGRKYSAGKKKGWRTSNYVWFAVKHAKQDFQVPSLNFIKVYEKPKISQSKFQWNFIAIL